VGCDAPGDLVHNKLGEYGEGAKAWTAADAKGFIKVSSTALRAFYGVHPDQIR
jgi:argininosuccinate synthase